ncbi:MAG: hypothetical protein IT454_04820 [Planctomycetes bacterium]|nr:hypothetical protein [Planctomycetota bacterium]
MRRLVLVLASLTSTGCATSNLRVVEASRPADRATFERLCKLAGTWQSQDPSGAWYDAAIFRVSSNGSVVVETMFPGAQHEMTNVYHLDGASVVLTHYCAVGNQPRMRAAATGGDSVAFEFDSVTNVTDPQTDVMSSMDLRFVDDDHVVQSWGSLKKTTHPEPVVFELQRKR